MHCIKCSIGLCFNITFGIYDDIYIYIYIYILLVYQYLMNGSIITFDHWNIRYPSLTKHFIVTGT